jgi:hypothetical protein
MAGDGGHPEGNRQIRQLADYRTGVGGPSYRQDSRRPVGRGQDRFR